MHPIGMEHLIAEFKAPPCASCFIMSPVTNTPTFGLMVGCVSVIKNGEIVLFPKVVIADFMADINVLVYSHDETALFGGTNLGSVHKWCVASRKLDVSYESHIQRHSPFHMMVNCY